MSTARQRGLETERILREGLAELARSDSELFRNLGSHLQQAQEHLDRLSDLEAQDRRTREPEAATALKAASEPWTEARVKAQFGGFPAAYSWLSKTYGIKLSSRAKGTVLAALNQYAAGVEPASDPILPRPEPAAAQELFQRLDQRLERLEQLMLQIAHHLGIGCL